MAITILPPAVEDNEPYSSSEHESRDASSDDEDVDMGDTLRPAKRARLSKGGVLTPGEVVTDDPQWMR